MDDKAKDTSVPTALSNEFKEQFNKLLTIAINAAFDCGEWDDDFNDGDYDSVFEKSDAADVALRKFVFDALSAVGSSQDAKDAARYRWIRKDEEGIEFRDGLGIWRSDCPSGDELDSIIDAAIAEEEKQNG